MRIRISHSISYAYAEPARHITQILRLTPRDHDGQHVMSWRIEPNVDGRLRTGQDPHGNVTHTFSADGPISGLTIQISGLIETLNLAGVVRGGIERVPPEVFRRETLLSASDEALRGFAIDAIRDADTPLGRMHALMDALHAEMTCLEPTDRVGIGAAKAFAEREGIAQDLAHVFIACARHLEMPARYVSGYVAESDSLPHQDRAHAWAEVFVEGFGWIGFDCANGVCPIDTHIRIASGLDYSDAAPVRGARKGGDGESLSVVVRATQAGDRQTNQ